MQAEEIRKITVTHCTDATKAEFGIAMLQEIAAQLATLNERLAARPELATTLRTEAGTVEDITASLRASGSIIPYLYAQAPASARFV